eukprot:12881012-Prorocentrum_lima.AAC.1
MTGAYSERMIETVRLPHDLNGTPFDLEVIVGWKIYRGNVTDNGRYIQAWVTHVELMSVTFMAGRSLPDD